MSVRKLPPADGDEVGRPDRDARESAGTDGAPAERTAPGGVPGRRRTELAAFLKARRARITPEEVGLPPGPRRRTPGLRREEVAQLAGLGVSWYTWLEQGRPINVSEQVLEAIARTLRLDRAERGHLFQLAGAPAAGADESHDFSLTREMQTILDALAALPAALYSARCDVVMHNAAFGAMFPDLLCDPASRRNALWSLFAAPGSCDQVTDRHLELPQMVAMLRANYGRHVGAPIWEQFIRELSSASPSSLRCGDAMTWPTPRPP